MNDAPILAHHTPPIARIVLNRPGKRNAINEAMRTALAEAVANIARDDSIHVALFYGAGDKAFSAGADTDEMAAGYSANEAEERSELLFDIFEQIQKLPMPTVAAIRGHCIGGGCALALSTDIRLATNGARFALPPAKLGIRYPRRGVVRAVQELGAANARYLFLTASTIDADAARQMGLVHRVYSAEQFDRAVDDTLAQIANLVPHSLRALKEYIGSSVVTELHRIHDKTERTIREYLEQYSTQERTEAFSREAGQQHTDQ